LWIKLRQDGILPVAAAVVDVIAKKRIDIRGGDA
jgi:hypothetical protein